jgi:hypothetical protein
MSVETKKKLPVGDVYRYSDFFEIQHKRTLVFDSFSTNPVSPVSPMTRKRLAMGSFARAADHNEQHGQHEQHGQYGQHERQNQRHAKDGKRRPRKTKLIQHGESVHHRQRRWALNSVRVHANKPNQTASPLKIALHQGIHNGMEFLQHTDFSTMFSALVLVGLVVFMLRNNARIRKLESMFSQIQ